MHCDFGMSLAGCFEVLLLERMLELRGFNGWCALAVKVRNAEMTGRQRTFFLRF
jgi:hypothetical protein